LKSMALAGSPPQWLAYVGVDDVASSTRKARELGAELVLDKTEVGDFGWMSILTDPTGATFALWQPKQPERSEKKKQGRPKVRHECIPGLLTRAAAHRARRPLPVPAATCARTRAC